MQSQTRVNPWWAVLTVLLGAWVAWGVQYTSTEATFKAILSEDDPYKAEVDKSRSDFPPSTSVLFAFETASDVFNFPALRAMDELTARYTEVEGAVSVESGGK